MQLSILVSTLAVLESVIGSSPVQKCLDGDFSDLLRDYSFEEWEAFPVMEVLETRRQQGLELIQFANLRNAWVGNDIKQAFSEALIAARPGNQRGEISDLKKRDKSRSYSLLFLLTALDLSHQRRSEMIQYPEMSSKDFALGSNPIQSLVLSLLRDAARPEYLFDYGKDGLSGRLDWTSSLCEDSSCESKVVVPGFTAAMAVLYSMFHVPGVAFNDPALLGFIEHAHYGRWSHMRGFQRFTAASGIELVCRLENTQIAQVVANYAQVISWLMRGAPSSFASGLEQCID